MLPHWLGDGSFERITACGLPLVQGKFARHGAEVRPWYAAVTCLRCVAGMPWWYGR